MACPKFPKCPEEPKLLKVLALLLGFHDHGDKKRTGHTTSKVTITISFTFKKNHALNLPKIFGKRATAEIS